MAKGKHVRGKRTTRNPELIRGLRKLGGSSSGSKSARYKFAKKGLGKSQPHQNKVAADATGSRFYSADDARVPLRSNKGVKTASLRKSIKAGSVVILLAGRFRGKRVIVLKQLASGLLLVTGPYKVNGVPLRRVNQAYVIGTSTSVDVSKIDVSKINDAFFAKEATKAGKKEFFDKDAKKTGPNATRKSEQKRVDGAILPLLKANKTLKSYLNAKFTLTNGQRPHLLKF